MRVSLLESDRSFLRSAECTLVSVLAHAAVVWIAVDVTTDGTRIPTDEPEARVFFLLPPDRADVRPHQTENFQWGRPGSDLEKGERVARKGEKRPAREHALNARPSGDESGARGQIPFGPPPELVPDTAFSVLDVDEMVERHEGSAAPVYPRELLAIGAEGLVRTIYVVDTTGRVDTSTIQVVHSDDPRFTRSVRTALERMLFRPARRAGKSVRQLVEQNFRFRIEPVTRPGEQVS